MEDKYRRSAK